MQRVSLADSFHPVTIQLCLSAATHRVLTADEAGYRYVQGDTVYPFESHLTKESRKIFLTALQEGTTDWLNVFFEEDGKEIPMLLRTRKNEKEGSLLVTLADPLQLARRADQVQRERNFTRAIQTLYGDTWWSWNPAQKTAEIRTGTNSVLPSGLYTQAELEAHLRSLAAPGEWEKLAHFLHGLAENPSASSFDFAGTEDSFFHLLTLPEGADNSRDCITGILHRYRKRGDGRGSGPAALDPLTGLLSRPEIEHAATERIASKVPIALVIADIDFFKRINDRFGHRMGDEVLRRTAESMRAAVGEAGRVGRLGGDEFLFVLDTFHSEEDIRGILRDVRSRVGALYPNTGQSAAPSVTISMGCTKYPDDARDFSFLFTLADACLYLAKEKGRNRYIIYTPEKHGAPNAFVASILKKQQYEGDRPGTNPTEALVSMAYDIRYGTKPQLLRLLQRYVRVMGIPCAAILSGTPASVVIEAGDGASLPAGSLEEAMEILSPLLASQDTAPIVINRMDEGPSGKALSMLGFGSLFALSFSDARGVPSWLLFYSTGTGHQWNQLRFAAHRLFADLLVQYDLRET